MFDLVRGAQLAGMVRSRGHLRPGEVVTVLTPVCEAVAHLHAAGGLHADISPANITVTPDGRPVLLDLGAARVAGRDARCRARHAGVRRPRGAARVRAGRGRRRLCPRRGRVVLPDRQRRARHHDPPRPRDGRRAMSEPASPTSSRRPSIPSPGSDPVLPSSPGSSTTRSRPEPVEVVVGSDEASALTHRLRADAGRDPRVVVRPRRRWPRRVRHCGRRRGAAAGRQRAGRWRHAGPPHAPTSRKPGPQARSATAGRAPGTGGAAPRRPPTGCSTTRRVRLRGPRSCCRPSATGAPPRWSPGTRRALAGVHAPGSPSLASDRTLISGLRGARVRWEGLRLEVAEAAVRLRLALGGGGARPGRLDGIRRRHPGGRPRRQAPPMSGVSSTSASCAEPQGWRISAISAAPAT